MSSIVDSQVFISSSITDKLKTRSQNNSIIRAIVQKINNNNQDIVTIKDPKNYSVSTKISHKGMEYLLKAQGNQTQGIATITVSKADLLTSKNFAFKQLQQSFMRILSYRQQRVASQATYYTNQGRLSMRLKIFLQGGSILSKSTAYSYSKIFMRNFEQFVINIENNISQDGCIPINKERQLQLKQQLYLSTIMSKTISSFNINDELAHDEENRIRKRLQKKQIYEINSKIIDQGQMDDQVRSLFQSLPMEKNSSWLKNNFIHIGENYISKYTNSLQLVNLTQKKREDYCYNVIRAGIKEKRARPIAQGGSCLIYCNKITCTFLQDSNQVKKSEVNIQKMVCFKSLKPQYQKVLKVKLEHQKQIVSKLKSTTSMFLPKYYGTLPQSQFSNSILMQYIQGEQLDSFLKRRSATLSLQVKLYILLNIIYGMLDLIRCNIVHLDLKPLNIIISKGLVPKLIDYGESYHKEVCSKAYLPGFSFPYVAPEVYQKYEDTVVRKTKKELQFCEKQDVFAFGIIMREVLFGNQSFQLNQQKSREIYYNGKVNQRMFQAPESLRNSGDITRLQFLMSISDRCTDPIPENRPNFDWIGNLLKITLGSLKNN